MNVNITSDKCIEIENGSSKGPYKDLSVSADADTGLVFKNGKDDVLSLSASYYPSHVIKRDGAAIAALTKTTLLSIAARLRREVCNRQEIQRPRNIADAFDLEGWIKTGTVDYNASHLSTVHAATTAQTKLVDQGILCDAGFILRTKSLLLTSNGKGYGVINVIQGSAQQLDNASVLYKKTFSDAGGDLPVSFGQKGIYIYEKGYINAQFYANSTTNPDVSFNQVSERITADLNFEFPYVMLHCGDSISYTSLGNIGAGATANNGLTMYGRRANMALVADGIPIRYVNAGIAAITAAAYVGKFIAGEFDQILKYTNIVLFALNGINDSNTGDAASQGFSSNVQIMLDRAFLINPNLTIVLCGASGTSYATRQANLPGYRAALAGIKDLVKYAGKDIVYCNLLDAVPNPTGASDVNYTETAAGAQLHPRGDTGHSAMATLVYNAIKTTQFYQKSAGL